MLSTQTLQATPWSRKKSKRLWRWNASGKGTFSGRGMNGQNCRSGGWVPDWFEWGQTPLFRRMPKLKGFSNAMFKKEFNIINISDLELLAKAGNSEITKQLLLENRIIRKKSLPVKLLWNGELTSKISISVACASQWAIAIVEKAWGTVTVEAATTTEK